MFFSNIFYYQVLNYINIYVLKEQYLDKKLFFSKLFHNDG